ncbi:hypothetical protein OKW35_009672 [Paraburkholderia sp. MM5477-R1]
MTRQSIGGAVKRVLQCAAVAVRSKKRRTRAQRIGRNDRQCVRRFGSMEATSSPAIELQAM